MSYKTRNRMDRVVAIVLTLLMTLTMFPMNAFAVSGSTLTTDIGEKTFAIGQTTEFTFTTTANDDAGMMVKGSFEFSEPDAIEKLEYRESKNGDWYEFYGDFGPETGFPMSDATSTFRVSFKRAGSYTLTASMKKVEDGSVLCSTTKNITVTKTDSVITTDIEEKQFVVNKATEFTFTTKANDDASTMVIGTFDFSDPDALEKLEYKESKDGQWYELKGDFGPSGGFPMSDATSTFRATFKKAGTYSFTVSMKKADGGDVLCSVESRITVLGQYKVTTRANEGGNVTLNGENIDSLVVDENTSVKVSAQADEGYQIAEVIIGNESQILTDPSKFEKSVTVTADTDINVTFVKIYTIEVEYNTGSDKVTINGNDVANGGTVIVKNEENFSLAATPAEGYRVSKVTLNNNDVDFTGKGKNDATYSTGDITAKEDYVYVIEFAPNVYNVKLECSTGGSATLSPADGKVAYNSYAYISDIVEFDGYDYQDVKVYDADNNELSDVISDENGKIKVLIKEDTVIKVLFALQQKLDFEKSVKIDPNYLRKVDSENLYIYSKNARVNLSPIGKNYIAINDDPVTKKNAKTSYSYQTSFAVNNASIYSINYSKWDIFRTRPRYDTTVVTGTPVKFVIDKSEPQIVLDDKNSSYSASKAFYKDDVKFVFDVNEVADAISAENGFSGIKTISYKVSYMNGEEEIITQGAGFVVSENQVQDGILYEDSTLGYLKEKKGIEVVVSKENNNFDNLVLTLIAEDFAGNKSEYKSKAFTLSTDVPELSVFVNGNVAEEGIDTYYNKVRTATITIANNRKSLFNKDNLIKAITVKKDDKPVTVTLSDPSPVKGKSDTYQVSFPLNEEGCYEWSLGEYVNNAGVSAKATGNGYYTVESGSENTFAFTVDTVKPRGKIEAVSRTWDRILETLTFGIWTSDTVVVKATGYDEDGSGIQKENGVVYYKVTNPTEIIADYETLEGLYKGGNFSSERIEASANDEFLVYARIADNAGNYIFVSTDGIIIDGESGTIEATGENKSIITSEALNGFYNKDVVLDFTVKEKINNEQNQSIAYSGLKKIWYVVQRDCTVDKETGKVTGTVTAEEVLYNFGYTRNNDKNGYDTHSGNLEITDKTNGDDNKSGAVPVKDDLLTKWTGKITVNAKDNNSDFVNVSIFAEDNAGNTWSWGEYNTIAINTNQPVLTLSFNDEQVKPNGEDSIYFKTTEAKRVATIRISNDRISAFNNEINTLVLNGEAPQVGLYINATDSQGNTVTLKDGKDIIFSGFNYDTASDECVATVEFVADAEYKWGFAYTNLAGNAAKVDDKETKAAYHFVSDSVVPTGTVKIKGNVWNKLLEIITFGLYDKNSLEFSASVKDDTSPASIKYYITSDKSMKSDTTLDDLYNKGSFSAYKDEPITITGDRSVVVFTRIEDAAGNYQYLCSDGHIIDNNVPAIKVTVSPENRFSYVELAGIAKAYEKSEITDNKTVYKYFKGDVTLEVEATEAESNDKSYAGIKSISYWIECGGQETLPETFVYDFTNDFSGYDSEKIADEQTGKIERNEEDAEHAPKWDDIKKQVTESFTIDADANNGSDTVVYIKVVDNAGNVSTTETHLDIDVAEPTIKVEYTDKANEGALKDYYTARTATVTITERTNHFDPVAATKGITITAADVKGEKIEDAYQLSDWITIEDENDPDLATHTAIIRYLKDANYTFDISYTDKANNKAAEYEQDTFCVDTVAPTGTVKAVSAEKREGEWEELREDLTFGFWSNKGITVTGTHDDITSPVASVQYYKVKSEYATDGTVALSAKDLDAIEATQWQDFSELTVKANEQFVVYVKIMDSAGNYTYLSTNGLIVDDKHPIEESIAPEITVSPEQPINGIYKGSVKVAIKVDDPLVNGTYSGLKSVRFKVFDRAVSKTEPTQSGVLYTFDIPDPKQSELKKTWSGKITVDSKLNNSNDIRIVVYAEDNAANTSDSYETIKIDTTAPVIDISYNNNNADSGVYFKQDRIAKVVVSERNFNADDVKITITNSEGEIPAVVGWKEIVPKSGNLDNTTHTATIKYSADGDYTFKIEYTDLAGNVCKKINYAKGTVAPEKFTIDKTLPTVSVSYNNNSAQNGKYFNANRTATVVIKEHNFNVNRVEFKQTATLNGAKISGPRISWTNNGDVHTATISYAADGDYTFDVSVKDMAGNNSKATNYGSSVAGKDFTIDTKIDKPVFSGVQNGKAYKDDVIPKISFSDVNYASNEVELLRTRFGEKNVDVTSKFIRGINVNGQSGSGVYDTFKKEAENDGIYTLSVKIRDKAGNEASDSIKFTVNRFGSVYRYSDYLISLIKDGGQYISVDAEKGAAVTDDLVITEYNADRLVADSLKIMITRDGEAVDVKYRTTPVAINGNLSVGDSGWFQYLYTISKDNFVEDGVYKIMISSQDATDNTSTSVPENSIDKDGNPVLDVMSFTVDTTAPEIRNVINLDKKIADKNNIVDGKLNVKYTLVDVGGISKVEVYVDDKLVSTVKDFEDVNNFTGSFDIEEKNEEQKIRIVVADLAGNVTDTKEETFNPGDLYVFNDTVTVSTNAFVRWYSNTALFWGTIGGFALLAAAVLLIIFFKKRKKEK